MPKVLTETAIRAAQPPERGTVTLWDASLRNFGLRISQGGAKTFIVLIGSGRRQSLGRYPLISLSEARKEAKRTLAEKTLGRVRPTHTAFEDAKERFLGECERRVKARTLSPRTAKDYKRLLTAHYPFGRTSVGDISRRDVLRRLARLDHVPSEKHHAYAVGRAFFRYCLREHIIDRSPMEALAAPPALPSRERALSETELAGLYRTALAGDTTFHRIVALLILTGQRRGEIARLEWEWISEDMIMLPSHVTKNGRTHAFPIGSRALEVIQSTPRFVDNPYLFPAVRDRVKGKPATVFNGWGKPKARLDKQCGVTGWRLHDLRRTFSSGMAALGVPQIVVEKLLNHITGGSQSPIAAVYNRYSYMQEMRDAILRWETYLDTLSAPASAG